MAHGFLETGEVEVAEPPLPDQPFSAQLLEDSDRVGDRRRRVGLVREVEIDAVDAEPFQAGLELAADPVGREPRVAGRSGRRMEHLRRQHEPFWLARRAPLPDPCLAPPPAVGVGRVEPADAGVPGAIHDREGLFLGDAAPEELRRGADAAEVAATERDTGERHSGRFIRVRSLRTSQSSGKKEWWISRPITSTGVPCVPITSAPIVRCTTLKWRTRQTVMRSSNSIMSSASVYSSSNS